MFSTALPGPLPQYPTMAWKAAQQTQRMIGRNEALQSIDLEQLLHEDIGSAHRLGLLKTRVVYRQGEHFRSLLSQMASTEPGSMTLGWAS